NDPRITRVGKILRALRIDELPQIFNILGGSMSVVGPRPERPIFAEEFSKNVKDYDIRFSVKAGLTGYAQIYGKYNTRVSDKILMDIIYILNYSILLDIKIILLTGKTMFTKSATEGFDEEKDREMISEENEIRRREETVKDIEGAAK
ncbi:MAG: sugar transferase, partial [Clostridia bacterium]|nr:sugar transferase [Clostridia bacterium]